MRCFKEIILSFLAILSIDAQAQNKEIRNNNCLYQSENVHYSCTKDSIQFGATITLPLINTPVPAVVLVSGTGKQDRDGTMGEDYKMFLIIADYLSRNGIAVLRADDRDVGETTGSYDDSTTADFAEDVQTSINYLKSRKEINSKKIGLIGHSEGGAVISIVASKSKDVAFIVSLAGLAMSGLDALIKQNADIVASANIPDHDKKRANEINELMFRTVYDNVDSDSLGVILNETYNSWKVKDDEFFKTLNKEFDHFRFPIYRYANQAQSAWYRFFIKYDPADYLKKINIPILALNGDKDLMVACKENLYNWVYYANLAGNYNVKICVLPGINHLFQEIESTEQNGILISKKQFSSLALKIILDWITITL